MDSPGLESQEGQRGAQRAALPRVLVALVVSGIVCRVVQYLWRMSYWHDEAFLILNIRQLSFAELFGRLPRVQAAPPIFLAVQKGIGEIFGACEYAYRFVPLLLGIVGVILMAVLARRMLSSFGAACALGLFAFSDRLIWHAAEAKQYSGDATVALLLLLIATWPGMTLARRAIAVGVVSALLVWWSHPVVFVCGGLQLVMAWQAWRGGSAGLMTAETRSPSPGTPGEGRGEGASAGNASEALTLSPSQGTGRGDQKDRRAMGAVLSGLIVFLISFAALYALTLRHQEQSGLYEYWSEHLADWSRPWTVPLWVLRDLFSLPNYAFEIITPTMTVAALAGAWTWFSQGRRSDLALLAAPILLTLIAALMGRFPFGGSRLTVFLAPGLMILGGAGFDGILQLARSTRWEKLARALPVVLIGIGAIEAMVYLALPRHRSYSRPVTHYVLAHRQPDEPVHVLGAVESFLPYWDQTPRPTSGFDAKAPQADAMWFVFNFKDARDWRKATQQITLRENYRLTDTFKVRGGAALRYERINNPATSPASPATRP